MSANAPQTRPAAPHRPSRMAVVAGVVVLAVVAAAAWLILGATRHAPDRFTGYVVSDNLYMAAPVAGTIATVAVERGDRVAAGAPLFNIDPTTTGARADQARAQIGEAAAQAASAQADLGRAQATLRGAEADLAKARSDLARLTAAQREKPGAVAQTQIDQARAALAGAQAQRDGAQTQAAGAQSRIEAARAQVASQRANLTAAQRQVADLAPVAPVSARVEEVMYDPGEWVAANAAVVSLVPDNKVKVRFYVPQDRVSHFRPGTAVALACDGCAQGLTGKVQFVASRPEYTPPVIYSLETRDKLVFMVEALPSQPRLLVPGQPMDVRLAGAPLLVTRAIDVRGLNKWFGDKHVVRDVSLAVDEGRITGFLGPNGSGKTTTLRLICGLLTPNSGGGEVLGMNFRTETDAIKRQTGYMTQKFSLYDDMTIAENLQFVARVYGLDDRADRVAAALRRLGLADRSGQLAGALSGGWKQRLALAAATLHQPKLLLLDEPTAGVDPKARREFWDEIHTLAGEGLTVLASTHYMDEAERCHDIGYILYGQLIARGTAQEIIAQSGLFTFNGAGPDIDRVAHQLAAAPGVLSASAFGATVHVSGVDRPALEKAIAPYRQSPYRWDEVQPSLEDVFIQLMGAKADDRYAA